MSKAVSAQYGNVCPVCLAQPKEPCRTKTTRKVTDTHLPRIRYVRSSSRVGEWSGD